MFCDWCSCVVAADAPAVVVTLPAMVTSVANGRAVRWQVMREAKAHRQLARLRVGAALRTVRAITAADLVAVRLTRIAPKALDTDNLAGGFKAIRDGIADALGIDDGAERLRFSYAQERGAPKLYAARVEVWISRARVAC